MGKHVCPICETVYAQRGILEVKTDQISTEYECWQCPSCGYRFVSLADMQEIISKLKLTHPPKIRVKELTDPIR